MVVNEEPTPPAGPEVVAAAAQGSLDGYFRTQDLGSTESVMVGAGGPGGATVTTDNTSGNVGASGGDSTFGTVVKVHAGGGGGGGAGVGTGAISPGGVAGVGLGAGSTGGGSVSSRVVPQEPVLARVRRVAAPGARSPPLSGMAVLGVHLCN